MECVVSVYTQSKTVGVWGGLAINITDTECQAISYLLCYLSEYRLLDLGQKLELNEKHVMSACADALVKLGQVNTLYFQNSIL